MAYAARSDIDELWGADFLTDILPAELTEPADIDAVVSGVLIKVSDQIDLHLSARYDLPLKTSPPGLVQPAVDIAVYILANRHSSLTKTIEDRNEQAIELLKRIADGKAGLGTAEPKVDGGGSTTATSSGADFSAEERLFTRETMK